MRTLFLMTLIFVIAILFAVKGWYEYKTMLYEIQEYSYFEGQKDALCGDIRIKEVYPDCWTWIASPWDNGQLPIWNPSNCIK